MSELFQITGASLDKYGVMRCDNCGCDLNPVGALKHMAHSEGTKSSADIYECAACRQIIERKISKKYVKGHPNKAAVKFGGTAR